MELGIGAGWWAADYTALGVTQDPAGERVSRLIESVGIVSAFFAGDEVNGEGPHYRVTGLQGRPRSVQRPRPPLILGGGSPRILRFAGSVADVVSVQASSATGISTRAGQPVGRSQTLQKLTWIREGAGDRLTTCRCSHPSTPSGSPPRREARQNRCCSNTAYETMPLATQRLH